MKINKNTDKEEKLVILNITDWHLLHKRTKTTDIIAELSKYLFEDIWQHTSRIDILHITGDVFDDLSYLAAGELYHVFTFFHKLLTFCKSRGIRVKVLEGTPSHDWHQSQWMVHINERIGCDLKYFQKLDIEYCPETQLHTLYIPDEWRPDPKTTYKEVLDLMKEKGIDKVDFAAMHGCFTYQLHAMVAQQGKVPMHNEQDYLSIVKYFIMIGHVHRPSSFDRILAAGSFSRLAHGEEEPKGGYLIKIYADDTHHVEFIKNPHATTYLTINIDSITEPSDLSGYIESKVKDLRVGSHVRVRGKQGHFGLANKMIYAGVYPHFNWSLKVDSDDVKKPTEKVEEEKEEVLYQAITITRENVVDLLRDRFKNLSSDNINVQTRAIELLESLVNA